MSNFKWKVFDTITQNWSYTAMLAQPDISYSCNYTLDLSTYPAMYCDVQLYWLLTTGITESSSSPHTANFTSLSIGPELFFDNRFIGNVPGIVKTSGLSDVSVLEGFRYFERINLRPYISSYENPIFFLSGPDFRTMGGATFSATIKIRRYTINA